MAMSTGLGAVELFAGAGGAEYRAGTRGLQRAYGK